MNTRQFPALLARYETTPVQDALDENGNVLAVFEFGKSPLEAIDPRHVPIAMEQFGEESLTEVWRCEGPVETGVDEQVRYARSPDMTMGHIALDLSDFADMRSASLEAYRALQGFLRRSAHHCPVKIWNYIPGINEGEGDAELYRQFCVGRAEALATDPAEQPPMPAATAIGSPADEPALQVYFLATALPGVNVENPRQLNAWHYPRQYGPRSPLFSRGTVMSLGSSRQFLISGTASVIGHETHHDNAVDQVTESVRNIDSLLTEVQRLLGGSRPQLDEAGILRVYVRDPADYPKLKTALEQAVPARMPRIFLHGDVCRRDLLTEIDGIVTCTGD